MKEEKASKVKDAILEVDINMSDVIHKFIISSKEIHNKIDEFEESISDLRAENMEYKKHIINLAEHLLQSIIDSYTEKFKYIFEYDASRICDFLGIEVSGTTFENFLDSITFADVYVHKDNLVFTHAFSKLSIPIKLFRCPDNSWMSDAFENCRAYEEMKSREEKLEEIAMLENRIKEIKDSL